MHQIPSLSPLPHPLSCSPPPPTTTTPHSHSRLSPPPHEPHVSCLSKQPQGYHTLPSANSPVHTPAVTKSSTGQGRRNGQRYLITKEQCRVGPGSTSLDAQLYATRYQARAVAGQGRTPRPVQRTATQFKVKTYKRLSVALLYIPPQEVTPPSRRFCPLPSAHLLRTPPLTFYPRSA